MPRNLTAHMTGTNSLKKHKLEKWPQEKICNMTSSIVMKCINFVVPGSDVHTSASSEFYEIPKVDMVPILYELLQKIKKIKYFPTHPIK